ncbi:MAG: hypothetical protein ABH857_04830 [Elusimicrobiota bacterium]
MIKINISPIFLKLKLITKNSIALFLTVIICLNPLFAFDINIIQQNTTITRLGRIVDSFQGDSKYYVYCIENMHCNTDIQKQISCIIRALINENGNDLKIVGAEGAEGFYDTSILSGFPDIELRNKLIESMIEEGEITGPELFDLYNPNEIRLFGVEDRGVYNENFKYLYNIITSKSDELLTRVQSIIGNHKSRFSSSALLKFEKDLDNYSQRTIRNSSYFEFLHSKAKKLNIPLKNYQNFINEYNSLILQDAIQREALYFETKVLIRNLENTVNDKRFLDLINLREYNEDAYMDLKRVVEEYNINLKEYNEVKKYFKYLDYKNEVNESALGTEINEIIYKIKRALTDYEKQGIDYVLLEAGFNLYKGYIMNNISQNEAVLWENERTKFYDELTKIVGASGRPEVNDEEMRSLKQYDDNAQKFYDFADKRNEVFVVKLLEQLREEKSHKSALVFGGYHTQGVTKILRAKGISYSVIRPNFGVSDDKNKYLKRLKRQSLSLLQEESGIKENTVNISMLEPWSNFDSDLGFILASIDSLFEKGYIQPGNFERTKLFLDNWQSSFNSRNSNFEYDINREMESGGFVRIEIILRAGDITNSLEMIFDNGRYIPKIADVSEIERLNKSLNEYSAYQKAVCPLCEKRDVERAGYFYINNKRFFIVRCKNDGIMWIDPQPTMQFYEALYTANYFAAVDTRQAGISDETPIVSPVHSPRTPTIEKCIRSC